MIRRIIQGKVRRLALLYRRSWHMISKYPSSQWFNDVHWFWLMKKADRHLLLDVSSFHSTAEFFEGDFSILVQVGLKRKRRSSSSLKNGFTPNNIVVIKSSPLTSVIVRSAMLSNWKRSLKCLKIRRYLISSDIRANHHVQNELEFLTSAKPVMKIVTKTGLFVKQISND